jgi:1-acyl-sn-glycerol-3-phosphate acyltransferase
VLKHIDALVSRVQFRDAGHGYDEFGFHPWTARWGVKALAPLYNHYFRVTAHDTHHLPATGGAVLAANHAGMLPIDAIMLTFVGTFFQRCGAVAGSRGNFGRLLEQGELMAAFPEGVPGISKPIWKRYQLQRWNVGHCELAIRHGAPVIPVGIVGSEEMWPQVGRVDGVRLFGAPYLPVPLSPVPLPVRYHIYYGAPIPLHEEHPREASDDPEIVARAAERVKAAVDELLRRGLREREGLF